MTTLGPYEDLTPALGRSDAFFAVRGFPADESHTVLIVRPDVEAHLIFNATPLHARLKCRYLLPILDLGGDGERYYWAVGVAPVRLAVTLRRIESPLPEFWLQLATCLDEMYEQGVIHAALTEDTVAVGPSGEPAVFDLIAARQTTSKRLPELVEAAMCSFVALAHRSGAHDVVSRFPAAPKSTRELVGALRSRAKIT